MKQLKLTFLLTLLMSMIGVIAFAHDFEVANDGVTIYYNMTSGTEVAVSYQGSSYAAYSDEYTGSVVIPASVKYNGTTYNVTSIGKYAFDGCTSLTKIAIPSSVTKIGTNAFYRCSALTAVHITDLAAWCSIDFDYWSNYGEPHYYETNPLCYAGHLFLNGTEIKDLVIPDGVKSISSLCFYGCKSLTSVTIPNSVTNIGRYAFRETPNLASLTFHCESIKEEWFSGSGTYNYQSFLGSGIREFVIGNEPDPAASHPPGWNPRAGRCRS